MTPTDATLETRAHSLRTRTRSRSFQRPEAGEPAFPLALRGYDRDAVDEYVDQVNRFIAELRATRSAQPAVREALERVGEETSGILQHAHETAEEITSAAELEARRQVATAERQARELRAAAEAHARRLANDTSAVWERRGELLDDVRRLADSMLELADSAVERLPEPPARIMPAGAPAAATPPPPPAPEEVTSVPPPPPPPDMLEPAEAESAFELDSRSIEYVDPAADEHPIEAGEPLPGETTGMATQQMDALGPEADDEIRASRAVGFTPRWQR